MEADTPDPQGDVSVPVQAHFEGVLYSIIAASDQVGAALDARCGEDGWKQTLGKVLSQMPPTPRQEKLIQWDQGPVMRDVRALRVQATHHHYEKYPLVDRPRPSARDGEGYKGSRHLLDYCRVAVQHAMQPRGISDLGLPTQSP
jgi:hypothetical protein